MSRSRFMKYSNYTGRRIEVWQHVAENALGRTLPSSVQVHHVDGDKSNNKNSNLVICPNQAYHNLLHLRTDAINNGAPAYFRKCPYCKLYDDPENMLNIQVDEYRPSGTCIHRECRRQYLVFRKLRAKNLL